MYIEFLIIQEILCFEKRNDSVISSIIKNLISLSKNFLKVVLNYFNSSQA
jgi:hypothetical protein